jgi:hypothetical protein
MRDLIAREMPELGDRARASYFLYVNVSANEQNGWVGQQIRREIRSMMNNCFVDGESLCFRTFQTQMLDRLPNQGFLRFAANDRPALFDQVYSFVSRPGSPMGGSDLDLAKYTLLGELGAGPDLPVGIILTNSETGQQPRDGKPRWGDDPQNQERLAQRIREKGVTFRQYLLASEQHEGKAQLTYAHVVLFPDARPRPLPQPRKTLVDHQNETGFMAPSPDLIAPTLQAETIGPNRFRLSWSEEPTPVDSYEVSIREKATRKLVKTERAKAQPLELSLPVLGVRYGLTVAAIKGKDRGRESAPVFLTGEPGSPIPTILAVLAMMVAVVLAFVFNQKTVVLINGDRKTLRALHPTVRLIIGDHPRIGPNDVVIDPSANAPAVVAIARRSWMGGVTVKGQSGYQIRNARGETVEAIVVGNRAQMIQLYAPGGGPLNLNLQIVQAGTS